MPGVLYFRLNHTAMPRRSYTPSGSPFATSHPVARMVGSTLENLSTPSLVVLGIAVIIIISVIDYWLTAQHISFLAFYIAPVFIFAWFLGWGPGLTCAVVCSALNFGIDLWHIRVADNPAEPFISGFTGVLVLISTAQTITVIRSLVNHEYDTARTDDVTGVANRRAFYEAMDVELNRARRHNDPLTLMVLDLDNFKTVNDRFGHLTGDRVLRTVAETIRSNLRTTDIVARLGGDEFGVLLPETSAEASAMIVRRIQTSLQQTVVAGEAPITLSIGSATFLTLPASTEDLLHQADELMYSVKHASKDAVLQQTF
jgi:diguanylate cyclase (GGDEF)-like protein